MALKRVIDRGDVYLIALDPARGREIRKTRPCVVVSPNELNHHLQTVIVAPMTTGGQRYLWRVPCRFRNVTGSVALDQLRTVDRERLIRRRGALSDETFQSVLSKLGEMFAP